MREYPFSFIRFRSFASAVRVLRPGWLVLLFHLSQTKCSQHERVRFLNPHPVSVNRDDVVFEFHAQWFLFRTAQYS
jgi:hypothetical protein